MNVIKALSQLPRLLVEVGLLRSDIEELKQDPDITAELARCPLLSARLAEVSAEWRRVTNDIDSMKK